MDGIAAIRLLVLIVASTSSGQLRAGLVIDIATNVEFSSIAGVDVDSSFDIRIRTSANPRNSFANGLSIVWDLNHSAAPIVESISGAGLGSFTYNRITAAPAHNKLYFQLYEGTLNGSALDSLFVTIPEINQFLNTPVDGMQLDELFKTGFFLTPNATLPNNSGMQGQVGGDYFLSNIRSIRVTTVPEPSFMALLGVAAIGLVIRRARP